jgi:hypothetical protein
MRIWIRTSAFFLANLRICDSLTGTPHKFADLLLRNEPKNLQILDLGTNKKKYFQAHLWLFYEKYVLNITTINIQTYITLIHWQTGTFIFVIYK